MYFSEKLKEIRKNEGLSQEQLAEKIGVSRQAVTKWETGKGLPDIENMMIIAEIFKTTLDELISSPKATNTETENFQNNTYTSETIYDIDREKHFDIKVGSVNTVLLSTGNDEKLHICLSSEVLNNLNNLFKVKLDTNRNRLDVNCVLKDKMSRRKIMELVSISIILPDKYAKHCEISASVKLLKISNLNIKRLEYDGDAEQILIANSSGSIELTSKTDYDISVNSVNGRLDINQWRSKSIVHIPEKNCPNIVNNGIRCDIFFMKNGNTIETKCYNENINQISISGIGSELVVDLL